MATTVRLGGVFDRRRILQMLSAAFATEVAMNYFFGADYDKLAPIFFGYLLDLRLDAGEVWVAETDGQITANALLNPPEGLRLTADEQAARWDAIAPDFPPEVQERFDDYQLRIHAVMPEVPHYYLSVIATHPAFQGQGLGRAILGPAFANADESRCGIYLETSSEENVTIYRRLGFEVASTFELPSGPLVRWMCRPPNPV